jgi:hypothetical protein
MVTAFFFRIIRIVPAYNNPIIRIMQVIGLHLPNKHYVPWFNICMTLNFFFASVGIFLVLSVHCRPGTFAYKL